MTPGVMRQWYVVYSKPNKEELARFHLQRKRLEVFFPRLLLPQAHRKCRRVVPLFPNYLFVRIQIPEEYYYVLWSPGVKDLVNFNGIPAPLNEETVVFLMQQATAEGVLTARSELRAEQEVRIITGPFEGLIGIIQDPPDSKGRIRVLLKLLNREVRTEMSAHYVENKWVVKNGEREMT
jgi:transcription elongation factor/antiterminator RfaH